MTAPKPTALKIKQGNLGGRRLNHHEPQPEKEIPTMPSFVAENEYAIREWNYITPRLFELGLLTTIDKAAIAAYCMAYARWAQAEEKAVGQHMVVKSTKGTAMTNPLIRASRDAMDQVLAIVREFGMTPVSRTRLQVDPEGVLRLNDEKLKYFCA